ncbi:MAG: Asp-tRNA(Asn)/Glu-tRNA(Gln) amidotransferase subunit GatA [Gemmatimonadota bacterium]
MTELPGARALAAAVAAGRTTAEASASSVTASLRQRDEGPEGLHAFLSHEAEVVRERARAVDADLDAGSAGALAGVPVAVKDNLCTLDHPTTCASRLLEEFRAPYDATVVRRVREAGGFVAGKTNLDEFAMGSSTEHSAFGPTFNPHDRQRVPGGSSGGSAAAVAAGLVPVALGSDTGGSVRQPAAMCGVVGLKPSYGRVSRYGLVAFASSLDQVGTFGRDVADAALLLQVISGADRLDSTAAPRPVPDLMAAAARSLDGLVVGVPREYFPPELDAGVRARCDAAMAAMRQAGAVLREVSLPHTRFALASYYVIAMAEASSNLARYDGVRYGLRAADAPSSMDLVRATRGAFGREVQRRIMLGTYVLSAGYYDRYYARAQVVRRRIAADLTRVFAAGVDVLFTPTTPTPAFRLGERTGDPVQMYLADVFTATANLAMVPAASVPIGEAEGLPVGGQLIAARWAEDTLVRAAAGLERAMEARA